MNQGAPGALRSWPVSGRWLTELIRTDTGELACILVTEHRGQITGDTYIWGIRRKGTSAAVSIVDQNPTAVRGDFIRVIIDGSQLGSYLVTKRKRQSGFNAITSELPTRDAEMIAALVRVGGSIRFVTDDATYESSLEGASRGMANLDICLQEAAQINAVQQPPGRIPSWDGASDGSGNPTGRPLGSHEE